MSARWITGRRGLVLAVTSIIVLLAFAGSDTSFMSRLVAQWSPKPAKPAEAVEAVVTGQNSDPIVAGTQTGKPFTIRGTVAGSLTLGGSVPIVLSITNPNPYPITVVELDIKVDGVTTAASGQACDTGDFVVRQLTGALPLPIPASKTVTLTELGVAETAQPRLTLLNRPAVNQDGCKGVHVTLSVHGQASGAQS